MGCRDRPSVPVLDCWMETDFAKLYDEAKAVNYAVQHLFVARLMRRARRAASTYKCGPT